MTDRGSAEARDAGILVFGRVLAMVAEAVMPFLIVRLLGKAEFGAFSGFMMLYSTSSVILTAGFPAAVLYYLADRAPEQRAAMTRRLFKAQVVMGVGIAVLFWLIGTYGQSGLEAFGRWLANDPARSSEASLDLGYLRAFCLYPILDVSARAFPNFLIAEKRSQWAATFGVLRAIGMSAGTMVPAALGGGVLGIIGGLTVFGAAQLAGMLWVIRAVYAGVAKVPADVSLGQIVRFAYPLGITEVVTRVNGEVDKYLILLFMTVEALAEYRVGAWQIPVISITYTVGHVYMPRFVRLVNEGRAPEVAVLWRTAIQKVSLIVVPVAMFFIVSAEEFVQLAFTGDYIRAVSIFRIYSLITMARVASFGAVIVAAGQPKLVFRAAIVTLLSNLLLSIPALYWFGFDGPALGTAAAFIPMAAIYCYYIGRSLGVPMSRTFPVVDWLKVVAVATLAASPAIALKTTVVLHPFIALFVYALTLLILYIFLARVTNLMKAEDLDFAVRWVQLDFFRRRSRPSSTESK